MSRAGQPRSVDQSRNPSQTVGSNPARACADKPTWWWFAIPFERHAESHRAGQEFDGDDLPFKGGDDTAARKAGHERALITCAHCPLALACLRASWRTEEYGTYGAVSEVERFYLGGRGRSTSQPRSIEKYDRTLARVVKRYGSRRHPVVEWIVAQGLPYGMTRDEAREDGAA